MWSHSVRCFYFSCELLKIKIKEKSCAKEEGKKCSKKGAGKKKEKKEDWFFCCERFYVLVLFSLYHHLCYKHIRSKTFSWTVFNLSSSLLVYLYFLLFFFFLLCTYLFSFSWTRLHSVLFFPCKRFPLVPPPFWRFSLFQRIRQTELLMKYLLR